MFRLRNKAWAQARRTGEAAHWLAFKQLRNKCTSATRKTKLDYHLELISSSTTNPSKFWKAVNLKKKKSCAFIPPFIMNNNCPVDEQSEICDLFNAHFAAAGNQFDTLYSSSGFVFNSQPLSHLSSNHTSLFTLLPFICSTVVPKLRPDPARPPFGPAA